MQGRLQVLSCFTNSMVTAKSPLFGQSWLEGGLLQRMLGGANQQVNEEGKLAGQVLINALSLTTPAVARVFSVAYHWIRAHLYVGVPTACLPAVSAPLGHPNLLSLLTFINSVLPTNHLFGHHQP